MTYFSNTISNRQILMFFFITNYDRHIFMTLWYIYMTTQHDIIDFFMTFLLLSAIFITLWHVSSPLQFYYSLTNIYYLRISLFESLTSSLISNLYLWLSVYTWAADISILPVFITLCIYSSDIMLWLSNIFISQWHIFMTISSVSLWHSCWYFWQGFVSLIIKLRIIEIFS